MWSGNRFIYTALVSQIRWLCLAQPAWVCYCKGDLGHAPRKIFKITCSEIESVNAFPTYYYMYIGVILTLTLYILAIDICSFIIISTKVATVLHLLTQTTH